MTENELQDKPTDSPTGFIFRFIAWLVATAGPWIIINIAFSYVWAPEWFKWIMLGGLLADLLFGIIIYRLLLKWSERDNSPGGKRFRIFIGIALYFLLLLATLGHVMGTQPYEPIEQSFNLSLPSGERTLFITKTYRALFQYGHCVWIREGNSPFVRETDGAAFKCQLEGEPEVNGDTVRLYFRDAHIFNKPDHMFEYNAATGKTSWWDLQLSSR